MNLPIPVVGVDPGPDYALNVDACFGVLDSHNHASGSGVQITPSGLNINSDLPILGNNLTQAKTLRFNAQSAPIAGSSPNLDCLYVSGVDLYYNDGSGNQVRLTNGGSVAGTNGSIANLTSPASATFVAIGGTFVWQSNINTAASMDMGSIVIRDLTAGANGVTIAAASALSNSYSLTLPSALPGSNSFLTISTSGVLGSISQSGGITGSNIAASTVAGSNIAAATITGSNVAADTIALSNLVTGVTTSFTSLYSSSSSGTAVVPAGVNRVFILAAGGGGGGGGSAGSGNFGAGGGGSSTCSPVWVTVTPGATLTVTVGALGAGGSGGSGGAGSAGGNGGNTTVVSSGAEGTVFVVAGGTGGAGGNNSGDSAGGAAGCLGGIGGNGAANSPGGTPIYNPIFAGGAGNAAHGGGGAASMFGSGGAGGGNNASSTAYGAGGGGAHQTTDSGGGNGASGVCYIYY